MPDQMDKKGKFALGIFEEGQQLYFACLKKDREYVNIVHTEVIDLTGQEDQKIGSEDQDQE